jgi:predicted Zn-dependent peptidase
MSETALNRKKKPASGNVKKIPFEFPERLTLDNNTPLFIYRDEECEVVRIAFQFPAGSSRSIKRLDATFTNKLIASGTPHLSEKQISEKIDYYGAYFEKNMAHDEASFIVYSLKKYVGEVLDIVSEVLKEAFFPEHEVETQLNIKRQKFLVKCEKVNFLAKREFTYQLFGDNHPYGGKTELHHYDDLTRNDLLHFHQNHYKSSPLILAAGNIDAAIEAEINRHFGAETYRSAKEGVSLISPGINNQRIVIEKKDAVQSALRMGRMLFNRKHEDFPEMQVLTTVLGGYFGSRLMSNLREDKGYTYGVGCGISSMLHDGYFFISTEVGADVTGKAEAEIKAELKNIRDTLIPKEELALVKNYLLGQILKSTDGVFSRMNRFKTLQLFDQNEEDFQRMISGIRNASAERLQDLANIWLKDEDMLTVIAGKEG